MKLRLSFTLRTALSQCGAAAALYCLPAHAYGPFAGTDGAVVQPGMFELELNAGLLRGAGERTAYLPALVAAFGLGADTELSLEGRYQRRLGDTSDVIGEGRRGGMRDGAVSVKHVFRRGSLQGDSGASVAAECSLLLPDPRGATYGEGAGAACTGALSRQWRQGTLHLNAGYVRGRDRTRESNAGVIIEGPETWTVRPVAELTVAREAGGGQRHAMLAGAIWKSADDISVHLAVRQERGGDQRLNEVRLGLTWPLSAKH